ncbi:YdcF family protein [Streptococcus sp. CSL10205-OR2]|uniref:YdcF family protein n=1 Tax=Streptococcus sp. CSL10205-OR2 TaxID=2980558 RepID=UPI0021D92676|nr:YdcF family protein [Streptococcus sp. CSL10205-OR2]MCU9534042.1 YdcF family protein [Streptococcus sp. CSL10205-OR2]
MMTLQRTIEDITSFMFLEDSNQICNLIIIPGTSQTQPIDIAKKIIDSGKASKLLITGGNNPKLHDVTEAEFLKNYAINIGVSNKDIIIETKAKNTLENVIFSSHIVKKFGLKSKNVLLISKNYHARRILTTFEEYFQMDVNFFVISYIDELGITKDNWYVDSARKEKIFSEIYKIGKYHFKNKNEYEKKAEYKPN